MEQRLEFRKDVLASFGAEGEIANEVLAYNQNHFNVEAMDLSHFPLPDEPSVTAWRQYAVEIQETGSILPLAKYLLQLRFPIRAGISESPEYIAATRRGMDAGRLELAAGTSWHAPEQCRLTIHPTAAGHIPVLIAQKREDFVFLVRALTHRNEPHPVPDSMGACMVAGYNNWHRISVLRERFLTSASPHDSWSEQFQRIKAQKELYQDRFIILSTGPYSAVPASAIGLDEHEWLDLSLIIRREHECTHYFTRHVFSSMRNNLLDEVIADYMGITAAGGHFRADWLLKFFGLESFPVYREGGRLQNYRGNPPLSDRAFMVLQKLVVAAAANLETFDTLYIPRFQHSELQPHLMKILAQLTMEEIASAHAPAALERSFADAIRTMDTSSTPSHIRVAEIIPEQFDLRKNGHYRSTGCGQGLTRQHGCHGS